MSAVFEARLTALRRQAQLHPSDPDPCRALAEELEQAGRFAEAARARRWVTERRPDRPIEYLHLARVLMQCEPAEGGEEVRLPSIEEASIALRTAIEIDPDFGAALRELARLDLARARVLRDPGAVQAAAQRALQRCRRALELDPGDGESYRVLGELQFHVAESYEKAAECFARALAIDPGNTEARALLAWTHARRGDEAAAHRELEVVRAADPENALAAQVAREIG